MASTPVKISNKLFASVPEGDEEGKFSKEFRISLLQGRLDLKEGRAFSHEEVKRLLKLK